MQRSPVVNHDDLLREIRLFLELREHTLHEGVVSIRNDQRDIGVGLLAIRGSDQRRAIVAMLRWRCGDDGGLLGLEESEVI